MPSWCAASALAATLLAAAVPGVLAAGSSKRGLVFTPNDTTRVDDSIWVSKPSSLTWYYNYKATPEPTYSNIPQSEFEFVPMLWGAPSDPKNASFVDTVKGLIDSGINITNVLSFNEPDGPYEWGGSNLSPAFAAEAWVANFIPLREMGLRVGLPACTSSPDGLPWLQQFLGNCSAIISEGGRRRNCSYDFVTIHYYGNFEGLASHLGQYSAAFPGKKQWITEYNFDNQPLEETQTFFNWTTDYFDNKLDNVERYSLFAAFRSDVSNVGPNAAMLSADGQLTDIGAWYLGRSATGVVPTQGASKKSFGSRAAGVPQVGMAFAALVGVVGLLI